MSTDSTTDLYRYFDAEGRLLYVGISFSAIARAAQHREDKGWWQDVARMHVEHLPTRSEAVAAERQAIQSEQPLHNVMHNGKATFIGRGAPWKCEVCRRGIGLTKEDGYIQADRYEDWHAVCAKCDEGGDRYWICATRVTTRAHLASWTTHLSEKNWFDISSWESLVKQHCTINQGPTVVWNAFHERREALRRRAAS